MGQIAAETIIGSLSMIPHHKYLTFAHYMARPTGRQLQDVAHASMVEVYTTIKLQKASEVWPEETTASFGIFFHTFTLIGAVFIRL